MVEHSEAPIASLTAQDLRGLLDRGRMALEENVEAVNALNVFPVPDGDTGTNMLLTMNALEAQAAGADVPPTALVAHMARGALLGARGNSGVILAQFLQGLAKGLDGKSEFNGVDLAEALAEASTAAYKAVGNPVEGTMLTVIREVSEAVQDRVSSTQDILSLWTTMCDAAKESVARTPLLLPVLREAGVVDAGGLGLSVILEGALNALKGTDAGVELPAPILGARGTSDQHVSETFIAATEDDLYGYCTQFLLEGENLDVDAVREAMQSLAGSTVVVGGETVVRVHVHAKDPGPVLSYGVSLGTLSQVNIQSMDEQHREFVAARRSEQPVQAVGILVVASGSGLADVFRECGASGVLAGGDTMNPSIQEILDAAAAIPAESIIVLPNNPNIVPAAVQAAAMSERPLRVVPTRTEPQGVAALLAFNEQHDVEDNVAAMEMAISGVVSGAVCRAQRAAELGGVKVEQGQVMGLLERQMVIAGDDCLGVLEALVAMTGPEDGSVVTIYWGADTDETEANSAAESLRLRHPGVEVEVVFGGQPHYNYIVSAE